MFWSLLKCLEQSAYLRHIKYLVIVLLKCNPNEISFCVGSLLHPFVWASGEREGRAACCSGGSTTEAAGTAPEGPGWAGAEAANLLPGWVGQGPSDLPRGGRQVQVSNAAAGSLYHFLIISGEDSICLAVPGYNWIFMNQFKGNLLLLICRPVEGVLSYICTILV